MNAELSLKKYHVKLQSDVSKSFRCVKAANSLDIDVEKKSCHELDIEADVDSDFSIGLIIGASGSGKTTLAKHIYGDGCFKIFVDPSKPIIEQFPKEWSYEDCANALAGMGLTSVPCWIRPVYTLSNGQRSRAEAALGLCMADDKPLIIDEWTSVVDRTVAKVMSHCVQKFARKEKKKVVLLSCHYDVVDWLNPDWIIDCNKQEFIDRRSVRKEDRQRSERLEFSVRKVDRKSWKFFSKYHYLSDKLAAGKCYYYGLFEGANEVGFVAFNNYVPKRKTHAHWTMHFNRLVIHPDYCGLGLGIKFLNEASRLLSKEMNGGVRIMGSFSSIPTYKLLIKDKHWKLRKKSVILKNYTSGKAMGRSKFRHNVTMFSFEYRR